MSQSTILGFPVLVGRDPTLNVIGSSSATVTTSRQAATDLLGQYTSFAALQAVTTAGLNRTGLISEAVVGGVSYRYAFVAGTATANSPLVLLPNDYNASTNAFSYQLLGIVHGSLFLPATSVAPATPATGVVLYSNSAGNLVTLGASIPANSVLTPTGFTTTLPTAVQVAPGSLNNGTGAGATTFWRGDGVWAAPTTEGYVVGPGTSVTNTLATWNGTSGTALNSIGVVGSANALTALNSITSVAASNLILATGTFGTAITIASATGIPTLAGNSLAMAGGSSITDSGSGQLNLTAGGTNTNIVLTPNGVGYVWTTGQLRVGAPGGIGDAYFGVTYSSASNDGIGIYNTNTGGKKWLIGDAATGTAGSFGIYNSTNTLKSLTISGAGNTILGTNTDNSNGILQLAASISATAGIAQGTSWSIYSPSAGAMILATGASGGVTALTLSSSQNATFAGNVVISSGKTFQLGNAVAASTPVGTGTVAMQDSTGATIYVMVSTVH